MDSSAIGLLIFWILKILVIFTYKSRFKKKKEQILAHEMVVCLIA